MVTIEEIFCAVDDFCKNNDVNYEKTQLTTGKKTRNRSTKLTISEIITIIIYYQFSKYKDFKAYYLLHVCHNLKSAFPRLISYSRFIELLPRALNTMILFLHSNLAEPTGISFVDSTQIAVCHKKRIYRHKVFDGLAAIGYSSKGWYLGFKLHLICNHKGELISVKITTANTDDKQPIPSMAKKLFGKLFGDKGYISNKLSEELLDKGVVLITSIRKNMKPRIMSLFDRLVLKKRTLIESINNQIKTKFDLEHSRHRSPLNGFTHMISTLIAYCLNPTKPAANISFHNELKELQSMA